MYKIIVANENNQQLTFNDLDGDFQITQISGLYPADALINTDQTALTDGGRYNSSKVNMRTINFGFSIEKNPEESRRKVYRVLQPKRYVKLNYTSELYDVYIEGYVENVIVSHFDKKQTVTFQMLCPFPYFRNAQLMVNELTAVQGMFHFPFALPAAGEPFGEIVSVANAFIPNDGMIEAGLIIELYAKAGLSGIKVYNYATQQYIGVDYTMQAGDLITITTGQGDKTVTLLREGVKSNIFNSIMEGSTWLQLPSEGMTAVYTIEEGYNTDLIVTIKHYDLFEGV